MFSAWLVALHDDFGPLQFCVRPEHPHTGLEANGAVTGTRHVSVVQHGFPVHHNPVRGDVDVTDQNVLTVLAFGHHHLRLTGRREILLCCRSRECKIHVTLMPDGVGVCDRQLGCRLRFLGLAKALDIDEFRVWHAFSLGWCGYNFPHYLMPGILVILAYTYWTMPDYITVENAANLLVNGGFEEETPPGQDPIGWEFRQLLHAVPPVSAGDSCPVNTDLLLATDRPRNGWFREVSPQRQPGYRSHIQFTIAGEYAEVRPTLFNRIGFNPFDIGQYPLPPFTSAFQQTAFSAYPDDLAYTLTFSVEVLRGRGRIETYQEWAGTAGQIYRINDAGGDATNNRDLVITGLGESAWRRFTFNGRFGWFVPGVGVPVRTDQYLLGPVLRFVKQSQDAFVLRFTACGVYRGHYTEVPYGGDLTHLLAPRGMVFISHGERCPPGFREMLLSSVFLKVTSKDDVLTTGGSETHTHNMPVKSVSQARTSGFQDSAQREITRADDHSHPIGEGLSVPPSRVVAVCVRY